MVQLQDVIGQERHKLLGLMLIFIVIWIWLEVRTHMQLSRNLQRLQHKHFLKYRAVIKHAL